MSNPEEALDANEEKVVVLSENEWCHWFQN
jgi:hypothetical protein